MEKKLQELEEEDKEREKESNLMDDPYHDIVEFAHNYFNSHERSPEGKFKYQLTQIWPLARLGKASAFIAAFLAP